MNYHNIYQSLVSKRQITLLEGPVEKHHIIPRCMGGSDELNNLVSLTAREHFIAHQLLVKIYPQNQKLTYALYMMSNYNVYNSKKYHWIKHIQLQISKNRVFSDDHKRKISESSKGKIMSDEARKKMSESKKGCQGNIDFRHSEETKEIIRKKRTLQVIEHSEETKQKISNSTKGRIVSEESKIKMRKPKSEETRRKMSEAAKLRKKKK